MACGIGRQSILLIAICRRKDLVRLPIAVVMDFAYESSIVCLTAKCWHASKSFLLANGLFADILPKLSGTLDGAEKFCISWYVFVSSFEKLLLQYWKVRLRFQESRAGFVLSHL